jgi:hypothetical protein
MMPAATLLPVEQASEFRLEAGPGARAELAQQLATHHPVIWSGGCGVAGVWGSSARLQGALGLCGGRIHAC